jgi:hypothetical protein
MFVKLARSRGHTYAQIVESYRDANGQPRQRNLLTLGRVDENNGQVDKVLQTLLKARGHGPVDTSTPQVQFASALALGDVWALDQLWREIGFDCLAGVFRRARFSTAVEQAIRDKSLADIERGFRVLKSEIEIAPVYHRLPERIRAHASICFMALILYRVMRQRLKAAGHSASPESALAQLRRIQRQSVAINQGVPITGISNIHREQADLLAAMNIRKPVPDAQLSLL